MSLHPRLHLLLRRHLLLHQLQPPLLRKLQNQHQLQHLFRLLHQEQRQMLSIKLLELEHAASPCLPQLFRDRIQLSLLFEVALCWMLEISYARCM
jgi:hypothetical protein